MTTSKKIATRTKEQSVAKVLDHRTRTILNAVMTEPRGRALSGYLKALKNEK